MKTEIDILSDREIEIWDYAESQSGTMDVVTNRLTDEGIFEKPRYMINRRVNLLIVIYILKIKTTNKK